MTHGLMFKIYKVSILFLCLMSMYAWFLWNLNIPVILFAFVSTLFFIIIHKESFNNSSTLLIPLFTLLLLELYVIRDNEIQSYFSAIARTFILGSVLFANTELKKQLLDFLTKSIAILLSISLIAWLIFLMGAPLPHYFTDFQHGKYAYENYYFFLYNLNIQVIFLPRFSSIFPEPGNLALVTTVLILANNFNFRKWTVIVLLLATLFSFSLAGYILLGFSIFLYLILFSRSPIRNMIIFIFCITAFVYFFSAYQDGQNPVNMFIFERLKIEDGNIAGYNRTTFIFEEYFKKFVHSWDVITGIGPKSLSNMYGAFGKGIAGLKVFIVMNGIIGILLMLSLYLSILIQYRSKLAFVMFVTFMLCFYQNTYPLAEIVLIPYILGSATFFIQEKPKTVH